MATLTYKIIAQVDPGAATPTDLYTVPGATSFIGSTLFVCNRGASAATFRVSLSVAGAATAAKDYIYYDVSIPANDTLALTAGLTMAVTDKMRVYASTSTISFSLFGSEVT